jgi:L-2,4-diaminobutyrate decarboxylase
MSLHGWSADYDELASGIADRISAHFRSAPPLGRTPTPADVAALDAITADGLGVGAALRLVSEVLLPNNVALDHPQFLAYIPAAPATSAALFDGLVGAWSFSGESWQEAGGAVAAENAALGWLRALAGLPEEAGGCFVNSGSAANLSALAVARDVWRVEHGARERAAVACATSAHSSVRKAAALLDLDVVEIAGDERGRLTGAALREGITRGPVCAAVASAGATNTGAVDELDAIADVCADAGLWLHVDAAYGGAALCLPEWAQLFAGVERCDSIVIDPHKWLFSPLDCAAPRLPSARARGADPPPTRGLSRSVRRRAREPVRSRVPPHSARPRSAVLVHPRRPWDHHDRHRRTRRHRSRPSGRRDDRGDRRSGAPAHGAAALRRAVRARRLGPRSPRGSGAAVM